MLPEERGKVRGKKQYKDRLTVLVCFNAEGEKVTTSCYRDGGEAKVICRMR